MTVPGPAAEGFCGRVWLVGSMGAGKSAVGRALAERLRVPLLDNDIELASRTGRATAALAREAGESLHDSESAQLRAAAALDGPFVAGVAASVADRPRDMDLLGRTGFVVYLWAPASVLASRVTRDAAEGGQRPWVDQQPFDWLSAALEHRDGAYRAAADLVVDTSCGGPDQLAQTIIEALPRSARAEPDSAEGPEPIQPA